jgi:hypothetical protein
MYLNSCRHYSNVTKLTGVQISNSGASQSQVKINFQYKLFCKCRPVTEIVTVPKDVWNSGGKAPRILNLGTRRQCFFILTLRTPYTLTNPTLSTGYEPGWTQVAVWT